MPRVALSLTASLVLGAAACALPGTGGDLAQVEWSLRGDVPDGPVVVETTAENPWTVELTEAVLLIGPIYAFAEGPRVVDLRDLLRPARALAHAGDDNTDGIPVIAELLEQVPADLLDPTPRRLGINIAEAGSVGTMNIVFDEARFTQAREDGPTRGGHALVGGVARRDADTGRGQDAQEIRFAAVLGTTVPDDRIARRVESLPVDGLPLDEGVLLDVAADPRHWVRGVDFDLLLEEDDAGERDEDGVLWVSEPSQFHNAWYLGLRDPRGWSARTVAPDEAGDGNR